MLDSPYNLKSNLTQKVCEMLLTVSDIPDDGLIQNLELPITLDDAGNPDIARASLKIFKIKNKVLIDGSIKIDVSIKCVRCLHEFKYSLDETFKEEYNPADEPLNEGDQQPSGTEPDLGFYRNDRIDLAELIKEQVILSLPMKSLCRSGCQGICPVCGKDLNKGSCTCRTEEVDPRLAPLQKLKESINNRKTS